MNAPQVRTHANRIWFFILTGALMIAALMVILPFSASRGETPSATYTHGVLHVAIPYLAAHSGAGQLTLEVLDPEDKVLARVERGVEVTEGKGRWREDLKLEKPMPLEDLVWHRLRYRFEYRDTPPRRWKARNPSPRSSARRWFISWGSNPIWETRDRKPGETRSR
jgi:hypothetical protein